MTYRKAQVFLNSFVNYERLNLFPYRTSFKLKRVQMLLKLLGNPQQSLKVIHIAGSKGKGSTCAFCANILSAAGYKAGLYTSPHLVDVRERIAILQKTACPGKCNRKARENRSQKIEEIPRREFARLIEKIRPYAEKLRKTRLGELTYFEILTCLSFLYFREQACDFAVLETGIGGRLDATNVASALVSVITPISYEHRQVLGSKLEEIASEKAGIIKVRSQMVVTAPQRPAALKVIRARAKQCGADLFTVGKDVQIGKRSATISGQCFDVWGIFGRYIGLKIKLLGEHQIVNAAVATSCVCALGRYGFKISPTAIRDGLEKTAWPGRLQMISHRPRVILDAAHNRASACALREALTKLFKFRKIILVLGVSQDKDVQGILQELLPLSSKIVLTKANNPRALSPEAIKGFIKTNEKTVVLTDSSTAALKIAKKSAQARDLVLVCGSLFLLGEILKRKRQNDKQRQRETPAYRLS